MKLYLDHVGILEIFVEAQQLVVQDPTSTAFNLGLSMPRKGQSGLTAPRHQTDAERKEKRVEFNRKGHARRMKDPAWAAKHNAHRAAYLRKWRAENPDKARKYRQTEKTKAKQ